MSGEDYGIEIRDSKAKVVESAALELDLFAREENFTDYDREVLTLYRGDSGESLRDLGVSTDPLNYTQGLSRDFPIYFTTSYDSAASFASDKVDDTESYVLTLEVPFEALEHMEELNSSDLEIDPSQFNFESEKMYFLEADRLRDSLDWISTDIPRSWIKEIEEISP